MWVRIKEYLAKYSAIIILIIIALTIATILGMRWRINQLKIDRDTQAKEVSRIQNNYDASLDTIRVYKDQNGNLVSEKMSYEIKITELNTKYKNLFSLYLKEKNKEPIVIIEYRTKIEEKITNISTWVSDTSISFIDTARFSNDNYRDISGNIPYKITYHIKKNLVNKYAFEQALYFAYTLEENGCEDVKVVAFKNNVEIPIKQALKDTEAVNLIYKVRILQISGNGTRLTIDQVSNKYKIDKNILTTDYKNGVYSYYAGNIVPFKNIEPLIDNKNTNIFSELKVYPADINFKQGMSVYTGLYKDTKTGKPMIQVKSAYPGLEFTNIVGADIMQDPVSRKVVRDFRKEFGVGLNIGYGAMFTDNIVRSGIVVAIGVNYTPRFLQFGPSNNRKTTIK